MAKVTRLTLDNDGGLERRRLHLRDITEADAPLETVGQDLRKARGRKGDDLAQVSAALKIRKDYLEAIEEGDIDRLPGRAYAIGFVRTYAEHLGLDGEKCVERLKAEIAGRNEAKEAAVALSPPGERKLPQGGLILGVVLLTALAYGGYYLTVSAGRISSQPVTPVPERLAEQAQLPPPTAPEPASALAPEVNSTPPALAVPAPVPEPAPAAAPSTPPSTEVAPLPAGQKYGTQNVNSRITLRIHRQARIMVQGPDSRTFINRLLKAGDTYALPNVAGLVLTTADSGAVEIILDGGSKGFAGKDGVNADAVSLNPQDVSDRQGRTG